MDARSTSGGWASTATAAREQLEPVDQLQLAHLRAAAWSDDAKRRARARAQDPAQPGPLSGRLPRRRRLRRRPGLLVPRRRLAVRLPGTAALGQRRQAGLSSSVPLVREIGRYIYRAHIADEWFINFADASGHACSRPATWSSATGGASATRRCRRSAPGRRPAARARRPRRQPRPRSCRACSMPGRAAAPQARAAAAARRLDAGHPGDGRARAGGLARGAVPGRPGRPQRREPQPQRRGQLHRLRRRQPAIIDVGVETYTAKTFSSQALRDLDHAVGVSQPAHHRRRDAGGRARVRRHRSAVPRRRPRPPSSRWTSRGPIPQEAGVESWKRTPAPGSREERSPGAATATRWPRPPRASP